MSIETNISDHPATANRSTNALCDEFATHLPRIFDWAFRIARHRQDAMDIVQDVFLKWHRQCAIAAPDAPTAWLRSVTINRALEIGRQRGRDARANLHIAANANPPPDDAMPTSDRSLLRQDILRALTTLSDSQRDVLMAKLLDELTFAKIAQDMGIAVSTAKTHYLRAVRAMRDALSPRWEAEL